VNDPVVDRYRDEVGEPKELPADHPDRWQWEYRGTKAERERLRQELDLVEDEPDEPVVIEGQEELFA